MLTPPEPNPDQVDAQTVFDQVRRVREILKADPGRLDVSEERARDYESAVKTLQDRHGLKPSYHDFLRITAHMSKGSHYRYRAALLYCAHMAAAEKLSRADQLRKEGRNQEWAKAVRVALRRAQIISDSKDPEGASWQGNPNEHKKTKAPVPRTPGWREEIAANARGRRHEAALLLAMITGCRPVELAREGVCARVDGGGVLVRIEGAKVRDNAGQPWREVRVLAEDADGHGAIAMRLRCLVEQAGGTLTPKVSERRLNEFIHAVRGRFNVSAYSFRHALSADLKAMKTESPSGISGILGHSTDAMQKQYGRAAQSKGPVAIVVGVETARQVRQTMKRGPLPSAGLRNDSDSGLGPYFG